MLYTSIGTTVFYVIVFSAILLYARKGEKCRKFIWVKLAYLLLIGITVLRYDIGNDYYGMANHHLDSFLSYFKAGNNVFDLYRYHEGRIEFTYILFAWLFSWAKYPYVFYIGLYGCVSVLFLYKSLNRVKGSHALGLFVYIVTGILFNSWDWIRQSTAFMIVLYATFYIENKDWKRYFSYIIFASFFHNSALLMLPCYYLRYIKFNKYIIIASLTAAIFLFFLGGLTDYLGMITSYFSLVEGYEGYAGALQSTVQIDSLMYKMRSLLYVIFYILIILFLPKNEILKRNFLLIGSILFLIACGSQILQRISYYFLIVSITSIPIACQELFKRKKYNTKFHILIFIMVLLSLLCIRDILTNNNRGCTPYDHVFSERFERQWFRPKN